MALRLRPARRHGPRAEASSWRCCRANAASEDLRLIECSTLPRGELDATARLFPRRRPGQHARAAAPAGGAWRGHEAERRSRPVDGAEGRASIDSAQRRRICSTRPLGQRPAPVVPILFYRSMLLAADVAPIDALCAGACAQQGMRPVPIFVASLKDAASARLRRSRRSRDLQPALIVTATAFAAGAEPGAETLFDRAGVPVLQVIIATTRREAWAEEPARTGAGRPRHACRDAGTRRAHSRRRDVVQGARARPTPALGFRAFANRPEPDRVEQVADAHRADRAAAGNAARPNAASRS